MKAPRSLPTLLVTGLLALAPAAAHAQSAGDEQYSDPLGGQTGTGSGQTKATPKAQTTPPVPSATPAPSASAPAPAATTAAPAPSAQATPASAAQLPRTGLDIRVVAALGGALLLLGIGLRLRTADARP